MKALAVLLFIGIVVLFMMLLGSVLIGITGAWFLHMPFGDAYEMAWENPWKLLIFVLLVAPFFAGD